MLKQIIKLCETLLKVKRVFTEAYRKTPTKDYDPSSENYLIYEDDYGGYIIGSDTETS